MKDSISIIIKKYGNDKSQLVSILQDIQIEYNYLPRSALDKLSKKMGIPQSHIYSMATFFRAFSLKERGKHIVNVCLGTACHVRGGELILDSLERQLDIKRGNTTKDGNFTLETVNCMGCCATGPVVKIDEEYFGHMTNDKVEPMIKKYGE
ncbi:MAG: NAD(P)H-dependent oxidoreductase subunit E [Dehalococcoidia bacterium]|nr:NAD(P)H-dependent oxidoreductase subunit E [Dehalococcoidia bacterium]MDD5495102.1 NAD(P)H-dependent oxidoreductase subunit E [Dehalococcoidia bacterium]